MIETLNVMQTIAWTVLALCQIVPLLQWLI